VAKDGKTAKLGGGVYTNQLIAKLAEKNKVAGKSQNFTLRKRMLISCKLLDLADASVSQVLDWAVALGSTWAMQA
jgi:hypothetical protein